MTYAAVALKPLLVTAFGSGCVLLHGALLSEHLSKRRSQTLADICGQSPPYAPSSGSFSLFFPTAYALFTLVDIVPSTLGGESFRVAVETHTIEHVFPACSDH